MIPRLLLLVLAVSSVACDDPAIRITGPSDFMSGSGSIVTQPRSVHGFNAITLDGAGRLIVEQTGSESLTITADDNLLPLLTSDVAGGRLELSVLDNYTFAATELVYHVTVSQLNALTILGAAEVDASSIDTGFLEITVRGAADIVVDGRADTQSVSIAGAASYRAANLPTYETRIDMAGSGHAIVRVSDTLDVDVSGAGVVDYYGNPLVRQTGNGSVNRIGS